MTNQFTDEDIANCYRILNLLALVRAATDTIEEQAPGTHGGLAAGIRECAHVTREIVGDLLDKIEIQAKEACP